MNALVVRSEEEKAKLCVATYTFNYTKRCYEFVIERHCSRDEEILFHYGEKHALDWMCSYGMLNFGEQANCSTRYNYSEGRDTFDIMRRSLTLECRNSQSVRDCINRTVTKLHRFVCTGLSLWVTVQIRFQSRRGNHSSNSSTTELQTRWSRECIE